MPLAGEGEERLRGFHAHYGEDALAAARQGDEAAVRAAMATWIVRHPPRYGDAWHPYPLSTRIGNWLAALALVPDATTSEIVRSLWTQVLHLERNIEDDILGNHVIRNARALVLAGVGFGSPRVLEAGSAVLARELGEQVLSDGGHYERSPVYHLVVLRDLLEVDAAVPGLVPADVLDRMQNFAAALTRPDGNPALFNDGALDLAPKLKLPPAQEGLSVFPETGYAVLRRGHLWLAFDCGPPSPPYLPAHAHADALSFQLWAGGQPIVVDPGMPTYEPGVERNWFRGTRAHSTVSIDGRDQFELWGAFRSGRLPEVRLVEASDREIVAEVIPNGRSWRGIRHNRRVVFEGATVVVSDEVSGRGRHHLEAALPLGSAAGLTSLNGRHVDVESRVLSERLFVRESAQALVQHQEAILPAELGWRIPVSAEATIRA